MQKQKRALLILPVEKAISLANDLINAAWIASQLSNEVVIQFHLETRELPSLTNQNLKCDLLSAVEEIYPNPHYVRAMVEIQLGAERDENN